ncbi:MAG TPA: hypothetical protein VJ785_07895 [Anaerolineales bacterium]|nr:hypothetical protein [Anaerolineales bacterium]
MTHQVRTFARGALWALPIWAAMLFLGTLTHQPDPQTAFDDFAAYVTTSQFLYSHLINSILGAAIGSIGVIGLMLYLQDSKVAGKAITGMVATVAANILASSLFGAAAFAQPAMGRAFLAGQDNALDFYNNVYAAPLFITALVFVLLFIVGGIFTGIAIARCDRFPRWTGWVYAITTTGFVLSNFLLPVGQSITSALLFAATVVLAWRAGRGVQAQSDQTEIATAD